MIKDKMYFFIVWISAIINLYIWFNLDFRSGMIINGSLIGLYCYIIYWK